MLRGWRPILLAFVVAGCQATYLRVTVTAQPEDLEFESVLLTTFDEGGRPVDTRELSEDQIELPLSFAITPTGTRPVHIQVLGRLRDGRGTLTAEARVTPPPGQRRDVFLELSSMCSGVSCPSDTRCQSGLCVPLDSEVDAGGVGPPDAACVGVPGSCEGDLEERCDPSTGEITSRGCPLGCDVDAQRCARFIPTAFDAILLEPGASDVVVEDDALVDTTTCTSPFGLARIEEMTSQVGEICVVRVGALTVSGTLRAMGQLPLGIAASGAITIQGTLDVSADGVVPGAGGGAGGTPTAAARGPGPGGSGSTASGPGGGGGGLCGAGGPGGDTGAIGGAALSDRPVLRGGSGGGSGGGDPASVGEGGAGGGALALVSAVRVAITGRVLAGGGGGQGAESRTAGAGGGGSGGTILVEAPDVVVMGGVAAPGGGGGGGGGGAGSDGLLASAPGAPGIPFYTSSGGAGSGRTSSNGGAGQSGNGGVGGGGGGGGSGCVLYRSRDPGVPAGADAIGSPSTAPGLRAFAFEPCVETTGRDSEPLVLCSVARPWLRAQADCAFRGGELARVESTQESLSLEDLGARGWIGLHDRHIEGEFRWVGGQALGLFRAWGSGEPTDTGGAEDCAEVYPAGDWNDDECHEPKPYVCDLFDAPTLTVVADDEVEAYVDGVRVGATSNWQIPVTFPAVIASGSIIALRVVNIEGPGAVLFEARAGRVLAASGPLSRVFVPATPAAMPGAGWHTADFDDAAWSDATQHARAGGAPWRLAGGGTEATWIGPADASAPIFYVRARVP